jgi:hypothetical protein
MKNGGSGAIEMAQGFGRLAPFIDDDQALSSARLPRASR